MAAPTAPTLATIVAEGLAKAGIASPTSAQTSRGQDKFMEEIKNDIWMLCKELRTLNQIAIQVATNGQSLYSFPTDFSSCQNVILMEGATRGTAQAGGSTSITLAAADTSAETAVLGHEILIYSGTGSSQLRTCTAYNTSTKVATVSSAWSTNPDSTSKYIIIDKYTDLKELPVWEFDKLQYSRELGTPSHYFPMGDSDDGEYYIWRNPYNYSAPTIPYAFKVRYYANLMELDLAGTTVTTMYYRWRNVFIQGVMAKQMQSVKDTRATQEFNEYKRMLSMLVAKETYGTELQSLQMRVVE